MNRQKGIVPLVVILIIIGAIVIGGGVYYYAGTSRPLNIGRPSFAPYTEVPYEDLEFGKFDFANCIYYPTEDLGIFSKEGIVVRTQEEYGALLNSQFSKAYQAYQNQATRDPDRFKAVTYDEYFDICNTWPEIDFSQKTLLSKFADGGGCSVDFIRKVYRDDSGKRIIYLINVIEEGLCEKYVGGFGWILIPKIPSDYNVKFEVN